jgi:hypothetical protein
MNDGHVTLTGKALFELVWSEPMQACAPIWPIGCGAEKEMLQAQYSSTSSRLLGQKASWTESKENSKHQYSFWQEVAF